MTPTKSQSLSPKPYNLYKPKKKKKPLHSRLYTYKNLEVKYNEL